MRNRKKSLRIHNEIRHVLLTIWDPIGIEDEPNAQDEYDSYISGIMSLLAKRASPGEITGHLLQIANDLMGLNATAQDVQPTVSALLRISLDSGDHDLLEQR